MSSDFTRRPRPGHVVVTVDDEPAILTSLRRLLRNEPYELMTTLRPAEALEWIDQMDVSMVIADQRMPEITGTDLLRSIRERSPGTIRVMLTGFPDRKAIQQRVNQDIQRLITKPWQADALKVTIRDMLCLREEDERIFGRLALVPEFDGLVLLMRDLHSLDGSVSTLLKELVDEMGRLEMPVSIVDKTGTAKEFLQALNGTAPVTVHGAPTISERWILLVDPEEGERERLREVIEAAGHICVAVPGAAEALRCMQQSKFDLVLLNPEIKDFQEVRDRADAVPVFLVSDRLEVWDDATCARMGVRRCLPKPCRTDELFEVLEEMAG
jgi:DNA-binding NtrC family response regulator